MSEGPIDDRQVAMVKGGAAAAILAMAAGLGQPAVRQHPRAILKFDGQGVEHLVGYAPKRRSVKGSPKQAATKARRRAMAKASRKRNR